MTRTPPIKRSWWKRIAVALGVTLFLLVALPLLIITYPNPAFPYHHEVGSVSLRSDSPIDSGLIAVLAEIDQRLGRLEVNDDELRHRLFLCTSARRYAFFARLLGIPASSQGVNAPLVNTVFLSQPFLDSMRARYGTRYPYTLVEGDLAHVATHEIVHTLVKKRLGYWGARGLPHWKREGYPEYAAVAERLADDPHKGLPERLAQFERLLQEGIGPIREQYVRGQLMVEYLMRVEGWSFDELVEADLASDDVFAALELWARSSAQVR